VRVGRLICETQTSAFTLFPCGCIARLIVDMDMEGQTSVLRRRDRVRMKNAVAKDPDAVRKAEEAKYRPEKSKKELRKEKADIQFQVIMFFVGGVFMVWGVMQLFTGR